jgi:hypothetical protein
MSVIGISQDSETTYLAGSRGQSEHLRIHIQGRQLSCLSHRNHLSTQRYASKYQRMSPGLGYWAISNCYRKLAMCDGSAGKTWTYLRMPDPLIRKWHQSFTLSPLARFLTSTNHFPLSSFHVAPVMIWLSLMYLYRSYFTATSLKY